MRRRIPLSRALLHTTFKAADAHKSFVAYRDGLADPTSTYVIALLGSTFIAYAAALESG